MRVGGRGRKADTVAIGFRIPAELDRKLREMAQGRGVTPGAIIEELIKKEIERETQER